MSPFALTAALALAALPPPPMPPPAALVIEGRTIKLAYGSYSWAGYERRYLDAAKRTDLPRMVVPRGRLVRLRLGFDPTSLTVTVGGRPTRLDPERVTSWRVARGGLAVIDGRLGANRARYLARIVLS